MKKINIAYFILIKTLIMMLSGCDEMATLFHGAKPEDPPVTYTVIFDGNGAGGSAPLAQTVNTGTVIHFPDKGSLINMGYIFTGWNMNSSGGGITYPAGASITVTQNMVFYAQWLDSSAPQYTVTFNANGATSGSPPAAEIVYSGVSITIPDQGSLTNMGYTFTGWNVSADGLGTNYVAGSLFMVATDVTLYAKWENQTNENPSIPVPFLSASAKSSTDIMLSWNSIATSSSYNVFRASSENAPYIQIATINEITYIDTGLNPNTTYYYMVSVNTDLGISNRSKVASARTMSAPVVPQGATLAEKFAWIANRADNNVVYDIVVTQSEAIEPTTVSSKGRNVTVILRSASSDDIKTITLSSKTGSLFDIETDGYDNGFTFKIENIILRGKSNNSVLVTVSRYRTFEIGEGAEITENTNSSRNGGGVLVDSGIMNIYGGKIHGNRANSYGGGIYISEGTVNIYGGIIHGNRLDCRSAFYQSKSFSRNIKWHYLWYQYMESLVCWQFLVWSNYNSH
ncbi:MAG: InlB B-repeat-containing protein [Treponema sp.]|jgi:uncharacterized repeat protein (TIGR02543 family)|nr:InlB B-repeat-containing protein [Treponema sp.]